MKIVAKYLKKIYDGGAYGLRNVNLDIKSGDFLVILGESGSGKSTLLRVIAGLEKPTAGELYLDGILADGIAAKDRNVSMVFQEFLLYPRFTVWENVAAALERYRLPREEENKRVFEVLKAFGLTDVAGQLPKVLSGGQKQRVALARSLASKPKAVLFDEPLSNIAEKQRAEYIDYIKNLKQTLPDVTFIYVTHNVSEALQLADTVAVMKDGEILQAGKKDFVLKNPYNKEVLETFSPSLKEEEEGVYNVFSRSFQRFDENGNLIGAQPRRAFIPAVYDGKTLCFSDVKLKTDDDFNYRFIGKHGKVNVAIDTDLITTCDVYGNVSVSAEKISENEYLLTDGTVLYLASLQNFDGKLYFPLKSLVLYDDKGNRILTHYKVYTNKCQGLGVGKKVVFKCGKLYTDEKIRGKVEAVFGKFVHATVDKKGLTVSRCLDEEVFKNKKLCYCYLKGFDNYVAVWIDKKYNLFAKSKKQKKIRLKVDVSTLKINTTQR